MTRASATNPALTWDFALARRLRHGEREFMLDLTCRSHAQRLVLFGPSGAGKSLTLKMIAGLARPDAGHVRLRGETLFDNTSKPRVDLTPQARRLAYVFQDYALFPHLTVEQNVAFALAPGWRNPSARVVSRGEVDRWINAFDLASVRRLFPEQISGGQRQRTALARALVVQPRALLLDEPFAALDRSLRQRLRAELLALQRELQLPMLVITHDEEDVSALGEEVVELREGRMSGHRRAAATPAAAERPLRSPSKC